jgi:hypothetical protein
MYEECIVEEREETRRLCERMMHHVGKIYTGYVKKHHSLTTRTGRKPTVT